MAILNYLLPIFFLLFAFGEIFRIKLQSVVLTSLFDLVVFFIIIIWLIFVKKTKYKLIFPLLFFILISCISLFINFKNFETYQIFIASLYLVRFLLYSSLYFVFVDIGKLFKLAIIKYMFFTGLIFLVIGYFQYFFFPDLKPFIYLGWDMHQNRFFSSFFDPNFAGVFLVLILIFVYILKDKIFPRDWKIIPNLFLILNFIAIILTYSRGAYLMLLVSVAVYSIITRKWKFIIGLVISFVIFSAILFPKFDLESTNLFRIASIGARFESMKESIYIFEKQPMGVGFNTYRYAKDKYSYMNNKGLLVSHAGAGVENSFLFVLVTTGFVGLIAYIYLIYKMFKLGIGNIYNNKYALVLVVSLSGIIVNAFTINSLFYSFITVWIFVLAGIMESSLHE